MTWRVLSGRHWEQVAVNAAQAELEARAYTPSTFLLNLLLKPPKHTTNTAVKPQSERV